MKIDLHRLLQDCGALLDGHFLLTSGRHSDRYIEKFRLLEQPDALDKVATAMTEDVRPEDVDVVLGAAVGGILIAGAVSRILGRRTLFTERVSGVMTLRRGFRLAPGERVLVVEDIVTTGGSVLELLKVVEQARAQVAGVVCLVDRSAGGLDFDAPSNTLLRLPIATWDPDTCPLCRQGVPLSKPGRTGKS
ncbi:MAG: orotate phosphoribosyltransferase [Candidatus Marinimicrobia bacterium]|nr:orotate phosphoribosyltransferase [Candidatus Neomarinimicrobiota bacterium]